MAKTLVQTISETPDESADLKIAVRACISELESANKRMADRQVRINKLKAESRAMLNDLKAFSHVA